MTNPNNVPYTVVTQEVGELAKAFLTAVMSSVDFPWLVLSRATMSGAIVKAHEFVQLTELSIEELRELNRQEHE